MSQPDIQNRLVVVFSDAWPYAVLVPIYGETSTYTGVLLA